MKFATRFARVLALVGMLVAFGAFAAPNTVRVMTYNIHHGEGTDGKIDLERIGALIQSEKADIVGLQEVDKGVERTARRDLPAELARLTGMTCIFTNNFYHQGGEYGNAMLSKFPVVSWKNRHYRMLRVGEQRGLLQATLDVRGRHLVFMTTHIDHRPDDSERMANVVEMADVLREVKGKPVVLCGDFNCVPTSRVYERLSELLTDAWVLAGQGEGFTIPATKPSKRIDYVWLSKSSGLTAKRAWVPASNASDHLPLVVELEF